MPKCSIPHEKFDAFANFDKLPNSANVRVPVVAAWYGCSRDTVWRWARNGLIPQPKKIGPRVTAWNVGELRAALGGAS
jgi:prophage regulatory protein